MCVGCLQCRMATPPLLRIGCAAGFSGDRTDAAGPVVDALIAAGGPAVLIFETLAERTLALAQLARRQDAAAGYEPLLEPMLAPVLAKCVRGGVRIVSNFGAANPRGAALRIREMAMQQGLAPPRIAVIAGDDVSGAAQRSLLRGALGTALEGRSVVSANAYLGAEPIAAALRAGAQIVVGGRVADPSLTVGPALAHFGWAADDWDRLARATMAGHLLECGTQVTGGYYADPGLKDIPGLARLGYPIAEIDADGHCTITKPAGTGGRVDEHTVKEQLLYEVHDPAAYLTPDVVADIGAAQVRQVGADRVRLDRRARPCAHRHAEGQRLLRKRLARRRRDLVRRRPRRGTRTAGRRRAARAFARGRPAARRLDRCGQRLRRRCRPLA